MDLSVSPDFDAYWSYLIVLVVGVGVAFRQVATRLEGFKDVWWLGNTWVLFFLYLAVPVALFWFLDRVNAIRDTSLFAALLVGFGYERILSGNDPTVQVGAGISQLWSPFVAYANTVADKIRDKARRNDLRLRKRLIAHIVTDEKKYEAFHSLAMKLTPTVAELKQSLADVDANADIGDIAKYEGKAEILYDEVSAVEDFLYEMKEAGVIDPRKYWWSSGRGKGQVAAALVLVVSAGIVVFAWNQLGRLDVATHYTLWRLAKSNASELDRYRAERRLGAMLGEADRAPGAARALSEHLRDPGLSLERVDRLVQVLLENRCVAIGNDVDVAGLLVESLATTDTDARARIHRALVFLAEDDSATAALPASLLDWSPGEGDSVTDLQRHVDSWRSYWRARSPGTPELAICTS